MFHNVTNPPKASYEGENPPLDSSANASPFFVPSVARSSGSHDFEQTMKTQDDWISNSFDANDGSPLVADADTPSTSSATFASPSVPSVGYGLPMPNLKNYFGFYDWLKPRCVQSGFPSGSPFPQVGAITPVHNPYAQYAEQAAAAVSTIAQVQAAATSENCVEVENQEKKKTKRLSPLRSPSGTIIKRPRGRPRVHPKKICTPLPPLRSPNGTIIQRPRGRPRKNPLPDESANDNGDGEVKIRIRPRVKPEQNQSCLNCGTRTTTMWRQNEDGDFECNACVLYYRMNNSRRPLSLVKDTILRRERKKAFQTTSGGAREQETKYSTATIEQPRVGRLLAHTSQGDGMAPMISQPSFAQLDQYINFLKSTQKEVLGMAIQQGVQQMNGLSSVGSISSTEFNASSLSQQQNYDRSTGFPSIAPVAVNLPSSSSQIPQPHTPQTTSFFNVDAQRKSF